MEIRPQNKAQKSVTRGSGPGAKPRRIAGTGPRKAVIIRMPEELAHQLKVVAAHEDMTAQDFCLDAIRPLIDKALKRHGLQA
ncbi:MAG: hypothetical protein J4N64_08220 [Chloroflexi bacterium]|nr:hypothetical protein [Chloroflexota bacterium]MCH8868379.1 hypothetical protein [Chloroflexota bacterium]MCI0791613.1 hypothetical protein [Chloroflexota bacterium]MCI0841747.1 hypothetical protein [Chloroflexota bacterium]